VFLGKPSCTRSGPAAFIFYPHSAFALRPPHLPRFDPAIQEKPASVLENSGRTRQSKAVTQAFILGAGLGTRLRPLTGRLPKPLVPLFHRPLAAWALDACLRAGIRRFAINTHHLPEAWLEFGDPPLADWPARAGSNGQAAALRSWEGCEVALFPEPLLLETGGGLQNIAAWTGNDPLLVHNGDVFSTLPLERLIAAHAASGLPVTLALRSRGHAPHIALDAAQTRVTDIRGRLGRAEGSHVFTGIYCVSPALRELLPAGEKVSVIPALLTLAEQGQLGAIVLDEGDWLDLGERESYLLAHRQLQLGPAIHPLAMIEAGAIVANSSVGPGALIEAGASVCDSVVWAAGHVASDAVIEGCIVYSGQTVHGTHRDEDL